MQVAGQAQRRAGCRMRGGEHIVSTTETKSAGSGRSPRNFAAEEVPQRQQLNVDGVARCPRRLPAKRAPINSVAIGKLRQIVKMPQLEFARASNRLP